LSTKVQQRSVALS